jgi:hypothetical protein
VEATEGGRAAESGNRECLGTGGVAFGREVDPRTLGVLEVVVSLRVVGGSGSAVRSLLGLCLCLGFFAGGPFLE